MTADGSWFKDSACSSGLPVRLCWHALKDAGDKEHLRRLENELFNALKCEDRLWNPHNEAYVRGAIRSRLGEAAQGLLRPPDQVKCLRPPREYMYEIRWQSLNVQDLVDGQKQFGKTNLRLLFVEPKELSMTAVGLVAFEKPETDAGKPIQDHMIEVAAEMFYELERLGWPGLQQST